MPSHDELFAIDKGVKKYLLLPEVEWHPKEIKYLGSLATQEVFVAVLDVQNGTLDHWLHDRALLQDYGCAQPHELAEMMKREYEDLPHIWSRVEVVRVPEWAEQNLKDIKRGLFRLLFKIGIENRT